MEDPLTPLDYFLGTWEGHETGKAGVGVGNRHYRRVVGDRYLEVRNTSTFEPQDANPEGEVHEDLGLFSFDEGRSKVILREFHSEGFVIAYRLESQAEGEFVFLSEQVESGPPGLQARLGLRVVDPDNFEEVFELAPDGRSYEPYIHNFWTRQPETEVVRLG